MDVPTAPDDALDHSVAGTHHNFVSPLRQTCPELLGEVALHSDVVGVELVVETGVGDGLTQLFLEVQDIQYDLQWGTITVRSARAVPLCIS